MRYVLLIYQGSTPIPSTPEWAALPNDEQKQPYAESAADYAAINTTPGVPLGFLRTPPPSGCRTARR
jgi:hypothetical protein